MKSVCEGDGEYAMETSVGEPLGRENKENRHRSVVLGLALGPSGIYFPSTLLHHNLIVGHTSVLASLHEAYFHHLAGTGLLGARSLGLDQPEL